MPPIFRETPPIELVIQCLHCVGLSGITDYSSFSKQSIQVQKFEDCLPLLEPYYLPCKANDYLYKTPFTQTNAMTILRQILKANGVGLKYTEKSSNSQKTTYYQLESKKIETKEDITIAFE
jgi:hypothetical protein